MGDLLWNIALVFTFVLVGGVFAATEMALVTLRESQINAIAARGRRGAKVAGLARNPNTFLSAVQIGVTVAGFASAAYGATSIAPSVAPLFVGWGMSTSAALTLATTVLTLVIAYLSPCWASSCRSGWRSSATRSSPTPSPPCSTASRP